jgi:hypothetical protein
MGPHAQNPGRLNIRLHMPLSPSFILDTVHHFVMFQKLDLLPALSVWEEKFLCRCTQKEMVSTLDHDKKITQNYWGSGFCPLSRILKTRKHSISETHSVSEMLFSSF